MKKIIVAVIAILYINAVTAQSDSLPPYKQFPVVPPFSITKVPDSTKFTKADLKKKKATIIMIFSPDCEHCQHATEDLLAHMPLFKNVQIVMATPLEYRFIMPFYLAYKIDQYPNIIIGRDPTYFLGSFYQVKNFPSIFLYDKKGKLSHAYQGSVSFAKIAGDL